MKLVPSSDGNVLSGESDPDETSQLHGYRKSTLRIDCFLVEIYIIEWGTIWPNSLFSTNILVA